jgi:two-component system alkaline phosphatase synthesis response regulator PhoP
MTASLLIVEDEESLATTLALNLRMENYQVAVARSGSEALRLFNALLPGPDLVLLDIMLPEISGFDLMVEFRKLKHDLPVIFLTAKNQSSEKIRGLKLGADDYIVKPFELEELLLRISNVLKRREVRPSQPFVFKNGRINFDTYEITDFSGRAHTLSRREIGFLKLLTSNVNKVLSRDQIIEALWEASENASSRTIDNYILNFRKYFEPSPKEPRHFHSIRGVGYKFTL